MNEAKVKLFLTENLGFTNIHLEYLDYFHNELLLYNKKYPDRVIFGKTSCNEIEFNDVSKAKVVCSKSGRLMYVSRAGIPVNPKGNFYSAERAIWIFAFNKRNLDTYFNYGDTKLEKIEESDIIRFLELDIPVFCVDVVGDSWAVDEMKDIKIVEQLINQQNRN